MDDYRQGLLDEVDRAQDILMDLDHQIEKLEPHENYLKQSLLEMKRTIESDKEQWEALLSV